MGNDETLTKRYKMSRSVWIINSIGWDYDDSSYYRTDSGGRPYQAYTDKMIAESFLKDLQVRELRDCFSRFFTDFARMDDYDNNYESLEDLCKALSLSYRDGEACFAKSSDQYSDDELLNIAEAFFVSFYELVEVELVA